MPARSQENVPVVYVHDRPASFKSQLLQKLMVLLGKKNDIEKRITSSNYLSEAAKLPKALMSDFSMQANYVKQRKVWTFKPKTGDSGKLILYIHGGGYITNLTKYDWDFVHQLLLKTKCSIVVPDYPLVPDSNYRDVYAFFDELYSDLLSQTSSEDIIFWGNSAGGGIALGFAQKLRNKNKPQPSQIILISPWLDITMSNPEIIEIDKRDKLLGIEGLKMAGHAYAAGLEPTDYRVSPIYGNFSKLGRISLFIGTHDLFYADAKRLKEKLLKLNTPFNFFEYPKMFHAWVILTTLKESQHALEQIRLAINN